MFRNDICTQGLKHQKIFKRTHTNTPPTSPYSDRLITTTKRLCNKTSPKTKTTLGNDPSSITTKRALPLLIPPQAKLLHVITQPVIMDGCLLIMKKLLHQNKLLHQIKEKIPRLQLLLTSLPNLFCILNCFLYFMFSIHILYTPNPPPHSPLSYSFPSFSHFSATFFPFFATFNQYSYTTPLSKCFLGSQVISSNPTHFVL